MFGILRALGSAVIIGAGVKAGSDIYAAIRKRFGPEAIDADAARSPIDEILDDDDIDEREARLKAEKRKIDAELRRIKKQKEA